eukprot:snap_masked-scaffold_11-processed-gene-6.25-mRNA-1 protein AED:0.28 eAED:0.29 QI:0/-1/0/1/-1/1/1/0/720
MENGATGLLLPELQNVMKREPEMYKRDFEQHLRSFRAQASIYELSPTKDSKDFGKLAYFLAHTSNLYREYSLVFSAELKSLFLKSYETMVPSLRLTLLKSLILLKNKKQVDQAELLDLCFRLFNVQDKSLRNFVFNFIVQDVKSSNKHSNNHKLNTAVRKLVIETLEEENNATLKGLQVLIELYKKRILIDGKTVNVIASGLKLKTTKLVRVCVGYFLGIDEAIDSLEQDEADEREEQFAASAGGKNGENILQLLQKKKNARRHSKKTRAKERLDKKETKLLLKYKRDAHAQQLATMGNLAEVKRKAEPRFAAIELINDPLSLVEVLFKRINKQHELFQVRLNIITLMSRLIGIHQIIFLPFYSYLRKFLNPHQKLVTSFLACYVQATHELIPGNILMPNLKHLADEFVTDRTGPEVMAVGLNAIREILARVPALTKEPELEDLITDLIQYKSYKKSKSVVMAARGLLNVVREINPEILPAKERGKLGQILKDERSSKILGYGEQKVFDRIEGAELLDRTENPAEEERVLTSEDFSRIKRKLAQKDEDRLEEIKRKKLEAKSFKLNVKNALVKKFGEVEQDSEEAVFPEVESVAAEEAFTDSSDEEADSDEEENALGIVTGNQLEGYVKQKRRDLQERLKSVYEGREASKKFQNNNSRSIGTSNEEKLKNKNFQMVKQSSRVRRKQTMSLRQQQHNLKKHIKNLEKNKKTLQKISRRRKR